MERKAVTFAVGDRVRRPTSSREGSVVQIGQRANWVHVLWDGHQTNIECSVFELKHVGKGAAVTPESAMLSPAPERATLPPARSRG
jgi:hypothetical protein